MTSSLSTYSSKTDLGPLNPMGELREKYNLSEESNISNYLLNKKYLLPLLLEASKQIKKFFPNELLQLEIVDDPEIPNWQKLFILIKTHLDADQAFDKLQQLDQTWWLEASYLANNDLEIHVEFDEI